MSVEEKVKNIVAEQLSLDVAEVTNDAHILEDLNADSLDITELVMALEEEFDLEIDDDEAQKLMKVQDIVDYIEKNQ